MLLTSALCGCPSYTLLAAADRAALERDLRGPQASRFLRVSFYVTPFFGDGSKKLLTAWPPEEVRLLDDAGGRPLNPGGIEKILPVATRARVLKVEFPTSSVVGQRIPATPRSRPWIYLAIQGEPRGIPLVLVLREDLRTRDGFIAELERFLSTEDPSRTTNAWSESVRERVRAKAVIQDMPAEAVEMAWGYPARKELSFEQSSKKEKWIYPGGKRTVAFTDGRVTQVEAR